MDDNFNKQKDVLMAIKKEISLLHQQVDYLIRNEKPLALLDLDVMMNRTHTIYDLMCGVEIGGEEVEETAENEELPVGLEAIQQMFGIEEEEGLEEREEREEQEEDKEEGSEENEDAYFIEEVEDVVEEDSGASNGEALNEVNRRDLDNPTPASDASAAWGPVPAEAQHGAVPSSDASAAREPAPEEVPTPEVDHETQSFFLNFEPVDEPTEEEPVKEEDPSVYTTGDEIEMTIPHPEENPEETPEENLEETTEEEIAYEPVVIGNMEEKEDGGFELETQETLGDRLQQEQDPTLADKLQHSTLNSLQSAIGINDKFLFVNELFNGSMEKYNRSIENLDDLKTLNGALIYLNELRIELQWNSSNEAYKKLLELVHRKFGA